MGSSTAIAVITIKGIIMAVTMVEWG